MTDARPVFDQLQDEASVQEMVATIVRTVNPLAVVLFGSHARGDHRPTSDLDLLVIVPNGADTRRVRAALYDRLTFAPLGHDLVVATPARLDAARGDYSSVLHWAQQEGVTLYDTRS